jgi:hypothetical protein
VVPVLDDVEVATATTAGGTTLAASREPEPPAIRGGGPGVTDEVLALASIRGRLWEGPAGPETKASSVMFGNVSPARF